MFYAFECIMHGHICTKGLIFDHSQYLLETTYCNISMAKVRNLVSPLQRFKISDTTLFFRGLSSQLHSLTWIQNILLRKRKNQDSFKTLRWLICQRKMKYGRKSYNANGDSWFYTVTIDIFPVVQKLLTEINAQIYLISADD